jgi:hypothetical protein
MLTPGASDESSIRAQIIYSHHTKPQTPSSLPSYKTIMARKLNNVIDDVMGGAMKCCNTTSIVRREKL